MSTPSPEAIAALAAKLYRPARVRRSAVGAIYRACEDALAGTYSDAVIQRWWTGQHSHVHDESDAVAIAWEALAAREIIPMSWVDHPLRSFLRLPSVGWCVPCGRVGCVHTTTPQRRAAPWTLRECVTFASDPEGIGAAEALAEARSLSQHISHTSRVAWRTLEADEVVRKRLYFEERMESGELTAVEVSILQTGYGFHAFDEGSAVLSAALV